MPAIITGLRPYRSASLPNTTVVAVCASRKAENTQAYKCRSPNWAPICGMAVETMVASIAIVNMAAMTEARISGRRSRGGPPVPSAAEEPLTARSG